MRTNVRTKAAPVLTHEGAKAKTISTMQQLRRSVLACMLWEDTFYEGGATIADRIKELVAKAIKTKTGKESVSALAVEARSAFRMRHAPLLLTRELARHGALRAVTLRDTIQRADELAEFLAIYWLDGKQPLSKQVKLGLGMAFQKFNEYQLAKYNRDNAVKLRDVLFLSHAKPKDKVQAKVWKKLVDGKLATPETWEVALSGGKDKKEAFTELLKENKLGYMALLRNLRNMKEAGVDFQLVKNALLEGAEKSKALPYRFVAAAMAVPSWTNVIDEAMQLALKQQTPLKGKTIVLVDTSGSMDATLSGKSELRRWDAAAALAALVAGIAEEYEVYTFECNVHTVPSYKGLALVAAIKKAQSGGTYLGKAVTAMNKLDYDRLIVITDEQSMDRVPAPKGCGYMINVASYQNGVGYGEWNQINGFSEAVINYIQELENLSD